MDSDAIFGLAFIGLMGCVLIVCAVLSDMLPEPHA